MVQIERLGGIRIGWQAGPRGQDRKLSQERIAYRVARTGLYQQPEQSLAGTGRVAVLAAAACHKALLGDRGLSSRREIFGRKREDVEPRVACGADLPRKHGGPSDWLKERPYFVPPDLYMRASSRRDSRMAS